MPHSSTQFDEKLDRIEHYIKYPQMRPWIGANYKNQKLKILVIGESHYLDEDSTYHLDAKNWYEGVSISGKKDKSWIHSRNIIFNGINSNWKEKSKTIYRNTENALFLSNLFTNKPDSAYHNIASMNFFQRPAEITGDSIKVKKQDIEVSSQVVTQVINIIKPDTVVFTSVLAYKNAKKAGVLDHLLSLDIPTVKCPHPGTAWWNRKAKSYGNQSGKERFISFINEQVNSIA